jgi:putative ABC transport system permease protein
MRLDTLVRKSLFEKKLRTFLLIFSVAVAFLLFGVLAGFLATLDPKNASGPGDELMVSNRINVLQPLPIAYREQIAAVPGVKAVAQVNVLAGYYKEEKNDVSALVVDPESFLGTMAMKIDLPTDDRAAFLSRRDGILVDRETAEKWGWKLGDSVTLTSGLYVNKNGSRDWPFTVVGIYRSSAADDPVRGVFAQYRYLNENLAYGRDGVHWYTVKTTGSQVNEAVAKAIDDKFANSSAETKTQPGLAFAQAFLSQVGNINLMVTLIVGAGFITILFIVGNTIAVTVRQRRKQIATLKTLGFRPGHVMTLVVGESMLLAFIGGGIGLILASLTLSAARAGLGGAAPAIGLPGSVWLTGLALIVTLGFLTGAIPAWRALRLKPIDALARS